MIFIEFEDYLLLLLFYKVLEPRITHLKYNVQLSAICFFRTVVSIASEAPDPLSILPE
jgi:hypothetical protein